jgi:hypothetical protein
MCLVSCIYALQSYLAYYYHHDILQPKEALRDHRQMFLHKLFHQVRLHYQAGAQAVYTWRHKDIFENANEALASIGICAPSKYGNDIHFLYSV